MISPWYAAMLSKMDRIAWRHGYALAVHGSMTRDLDLIAVPWVEDASNHDALLSDLQEFIVANTDIKADGPFRPTVKPHGRMAYTIPMGYKGHCLDVSIMRKSGER